MTLDAEDRDAARLSAQSLAAGDPTGWFERLYAEAEDGTAIVPWDRGAPNAMLVSWPVEPTGGRALVVGCGLGRDSEYLTSLGFETVAFDVSPTAIEVAQARHPGSTVRYETADLFDLPHEWFGGFDLVLESHTVQSLPVHLHATAIAAVTSLVAPGGTLLVLAAAGVEGVEAAGPPWPLTPSEVASFGSGGLEEVELVQVPAELGGVSRWRAKFART